MNGELLVNMTNKAVNSITNRLQSEYLFFNLFLKNTNLFCSNFLDLAIFDNAESKISALVAAANSLDNLCRMDPAYHPWI